MSDTFNFSSDKKAQPTIISSIFSILFALGMFTIFIASLFNVIGLSIAHFLPNVVFPTSIQPYLTELFTWGTWMNIGVSIGISVISSLFYFFKKDKKSLSEKIATKIAILLMKKKRTSMLALAAKATIIQKTITLVPAIFNFMIYLHAIGLLFGIEQQPFVKGLCSFGAFANIFWPALLVIADTAVVCIRQAADIKALSIVASKIEEEQKTSNTETIENRYKR